MGELSHFDAEGASRMVDVSWKARDRPVGDGQRPGPDGARRRWP